MTERPFRILGIQQVAIGGLDLGALRNLWVDTLGVEKVDEYTSERENVTEDILRLGPGPYAVEIDLMQPLDPCDPDLEDFYDAYHLLSRAVTDPANQIRFRGHAGTMQVLDAHRVLHARRGFDGTSGARHLQDTYFEFDDLRALHARMTGEAR